MEVEQKEETRRFSLHFPFPSNSQTMLKHERFIKFSVSLILGFLWVWVPGSGAARNKFDSFSHVVTGSGIREKVEKGRAHSFLFSSMVGAYLKKALTHCLSVNYYYD
jgi:hypothetical protein